MGCGCATPQCDLDLSFSIASVILTIKILFRLYFGNSKVWDVDIWQAYWMGVHILILPLTVL